MEWWHHRLIRISGDVETGGLWDACGFLAGIVLWFIGSGIWLFWVWPCDSICLVFLFWFWIVGCMLAPTPSNFPSS
jgi:hypothetical protein